MTRELILQIHSILGIVIFTTGLLQIILKKGGSRHKIVGQVYLYSWLILLISGAYLGGLFITIIGVFGFYFALTGSRIGQLKIDPITLFEKMTFALGAGIAVYMLYYSATLFLKGQNSFAIIFAVFGGIFLFTTVQDIFKYILEKALKKQAYGKLDWYFEHFKRMLISFIAAVTAFVSIQNVFNDNTINFLMPAIIGTALIIMTTKFYKKKLLK